MPTCLLRYLHKYGILSFVFVRSFDVEGMLILQSAATNFWMVPWQNSEPNVTW